MAHNSSPLRGSGSLPPYLRVPHKSDASDMKVEKATRGHFAEGQTVGSATPIKQPCKSNSDLYDQLLKADGLLNSLKKEEARDLYHTVYRASRVMTLEGKDMLLTVFSIIGMGSTCDEDKEKMEWLSLALRNTDQIYEQKDAWDNLSETNKLQAYEALYTAYNKLLRLSLLEADDLTVLQIQKKVTKLYSVINVSEPSIPHAEEYDFYENLAQADKLLQGKEKGRAQELYQEIYHASIKRPLLGKDMLLPVICAIRIALTYDNTSEDQVKWASLALEKADQIYDQRNSWENLSPHEKLGVYQALYDNYVNLIKLIQDTTKEFSQYTNISWRSGFAISTKLTIIRAVTHPVPNLADNSLNSRSPYVRKQPPPEDKPLRFRFIFAVAMTSLIALMTGVVIYKRVFVKK